MAEHAEYRLVEEDLLRGVVGTLVRLVASAGALVIFVDAVVAVTQFGFAVIKRDRDACVRSLDPRSVPRSGLGMPARIGVLRTAVAPTYDELVNSLQ